MKKIIIPVVLIFTVFFMASHVSAGIILDAEVLSNELNEEAKDDYDVEKDGLEIATASISDIAIPNPEVPVSGYGDTTTRPEIEMTESEFDASVTGQRISAATISNIALPKIGTLVSDYFDTTTRPESDKTYYYVSNKECYWTDYKRNKLLTDAVFTEGNTYYYNVVLITHGTYVFEQDARLTISDGKLDPGYSIMINNAGKEITFKNVYKVKCGTGQTQTISSLTLSNDTFYYNGKAHKLKKSQMTVTDTDGRPVADNNYDVEYSATPKKVGVYTVTVTGKGTVSGSASAKFKINPSTPRSVRAKAGKGRIKVSWKQPASGRPTAYNVLVYKNSSCTEVAASAEIGGGKKSKTINGLSSGRTYYVKMDCYEKDSEVLVSKRTGAIAVTVQ